MRQFWIQAKNWQFETFGPPETRGPEGALRHIIKEIEKEILCKPADIKEYADLIFLVFEATWRSGFTYTDLLETCFSKLEENKARKWPKPSPDQPVEHIREDSE